MYENGMRACDVARSLDAPYGPILQAVTRRTWKHVS
jgi:hypothetical protein